MRYCSIDIETSGLDPEDHQILQIGAVLEDTKLNLPLKDLPKFECFLWSNKIVGSAYALNLNKWIFKILADYEGRQRFPYQVETLTPVESIELDVAASMANRTSYIAPYWEAPKLLHAWLQGLGYSTDKKIQLNVAGKNFATFDKRFLENLADWSKMFKIRQRIIDPAILFVDWDNDDALPGLETCKQRADLVDTVVTHDAVEDALDVIKVIRASRNLQSDTAT